MTNVINFHISLTSDTPWDPSIIDNDTLSDYNGKEYIMTHGNFDKMVDLLKIEVSFSSTNISVPHCINNQLIHSTVTKPTNINYGEYDKYFLKDPHEVIKKTFEDTTQFEKSGWITGHIYRTHKSPFPYLNVHMRN